MYVVCLVLLSYNALIKSSRVFLTTKKSSTYLKANTLKFLQQNTPDRLSRVSQTLEPNWHLTIPFTHHHPPGIPHESLPRPQDSNLPAFPPSWRSVVVLNMGMSSHELRRNMNPRQNFPFISTSIISIFRIHTSLKKTTTPHYPSTWVRQIGCLAWDFAFSGMPSPHFFGTRKFAGVKVTGMTTPGLVACVVAGEPDERLPEPKWKGGLFFLCKMMNRASNYWPDLHIRYLFYGDKENNAKIKFRDSEAVRRRSSDERWTGNSEPD